MCVTLQQEPRVTLRSITGATYVNGQRLVEAAQDVKLRQGDVLQFGDFLKFRFHNPMEAAALREKRRSGRPLSSFSETSSSSFLLGADGPLSPAVSFQFPRLRFFMYSTLFVLSKLFSI